MLDEIRKYLSNTSINSPFFLVVGDKNYESVKTKITELGLKTVRLSDYCSAPDKPPRLDGLISEVDFADIDNNSNDKNIVILGLGEYLSFRGKEEAFKRLSYLKEKKVGNARVVLILRGVTSVVQRIKTKPSEPQCICYTDYIHSDISVVVCHTELKLPTSIGIKGMLRDFEDGKTTIKIKTNASFDNAMFNTRHINSSYDGIKYICPDFSLSENLGTTIQWSEFLLTLNDYNGKIKSCFSEFGDNPENELNLWINGTSYKHWLYFIALKFCITSINNKYLKYVVEKTTNFADLKKNIVGAIIDINPADDCFDIFYKHRHSIIGTLLSQKKLTEADIADFVSDNRRKLADGLYRLTNLTLVEKKEFIALFSSSLNKEFVTKRSEKTYSALTDYLGMYVFTDPKVSTQTNALLTEYFNRYKWQKVLNVIEPSFLSQVEKLASERRYNGLRTREEVLAGITEKENAFLLWIDALGVEFLGYIQSLCRQKGLMLHIHIAQANLPTITSFNNSFFYTDWTSRKEKKEQLDNLKHKDSGGYSYEKEQLPLHLAEELDIIAQAIEQISIDLALHKYKKVIIASDHGASRLAVINGQEEKYDADEKGKHSGRICKRPANYSPTADDLPFATESSDGEYLILANYGRFKGSRKANIEVHGGATLEEVVVPIIEIMLTNPNTKIELLDPDKLYASFRTPLEFTIFSKTQLQSARAIIKGNETPYIAIKIDKNHYKIVTNIKRPGEYFVDVFDGDSLTGKFTLNVQSETQKKLQGDGFDSLFD